MLPGFELLFRLEAPIAVASDRHLAERSVVEEEQDARAGVAGAGQGCTFPLTRAPVS